jgi:3-hydroxyacyl-CoA dehydrogenase
VIGVEKERIAVVGGGLMGAAIAAVFVAAGHVVRVYEPGSASREDLRDRVRANLDALGAAEGAENLVSATGDLGEAVGEADYVTEAVPEKLSLKREVFAELVRREIASWRATRRSFRSAGSPKAWRPATASSARIGGIRDTSSRWSRWCRLRASPTRLFPEPWNCSLGWASRRRTS